MTIKKKALVTLLIGDDYNKVWETYFRQSWEKYADIHGYDIIVIDDFIDKSELAASRSVHWQKCLILEDEHVQQYEDIVWLDSDVLINFHQAPCIVESNNSNNIGVVSNSYTFNNDSSIDNCLKRYNDYYAVLGVDNVMLTPQETYEKCGLDGHGLDYCNTGVLVLKPDLHRDAMRYVYDNYEESEYSAKDEVSISHHIFKQDLANLLDVRFNMAWPNVLLQNYPFLSMKENDEDKRLVSFCVNAAWHNAYFLHFIIAQGAIRHVSLVSQENSSPFFTLSS